MIILYKNVFENTFVFAEHAKGESIQAGVLEPAEVGVISLSNDYTDEKHEATMLIRDKFPRKQNIRGAKAVISEEAYDYLEETIYYRGNYKGYTGSEIYPLVRSFAALVDDTNAMIYYADKSFLFKACAGYHFAVDEYGFKLVKNSNGMDYRPESEDVLKGINHVRGLLLSKARKIKAQEKENRERAKKEKDFNRKVKIVKKLGIYVSMQDSLDAGNCRAGTLGYIKKYGLKMGKHYSEKMLFERDNHDVKRAVDQAVIRQIKEYEQGFCEI